MHLCHLGIKTSRANHPQGGLRAQIGDNLRKRPGFPPDLQQLSHPELLALLLKIDPTIDSILESGAEYWGDLIDRLHFIADFFRCYLMSAELFEPPFLLEQVSVIREGRLPSGRL
jgi:hypothetical protein